MKPAVVFLIYHGYGHFNACFKLAKFLRPDYEVIFAGHAFFNKHVTQQGFNFYPLKTVPFAMGFEKWVNKTENKRNIYWSCLKDRWTNRLYRIRKTELEKLVDQLRPEYLLIDSWQSTDVFALYPKLTDQHKVALIQTMVSTVVDKTVLPANSALSPDNTNHVRKAHIQLTVQRLKKDLVEALRWFGKHDSALLKRVIQHTKIPAHLIADKRTIHGLPVLNIPEFVLAPAEFDYIPKKHSPWQHYIGFQTDFERTEVINNHYQNAVDRINGIKEKYQHFVYCSFGSVEHENIVHVKQFLERVMEAATRINAVCMITINNQKLVESLSEKQENVFVLLSAPQLEVLAFADVFITHGGLNSIKEAIGKEVPLLAFPGIVNTDLNGNASHIVYHGLGLAGDLKKDSAEVIELKLAELISNDTFRRNIIKLKNIDARYDLPAFKKAFEQIPVFKDLLNKKS